MTLDRSVTACWWEIIFYIYCPDSKKIISRSNIRSTDPNKRIRIHKIINPDIDSNILYEYNVSNSGEDPEVNNNGNLRRSPGLKINMVL